MNPWLSRHFGRIWLGAVAAIWVISFVWPTRTPQVGNLVRARDRWSLPSLPEQRDLGPKAQNLATSPLWGAAASTAAAAAPPPEDTRWVLAGVYQRNGEARAVVRFLAKRGERQLAVGDKIPSGEKIVEIGSDAIWVTQGKRHRRRLPLYSLAPEQP